MFSTAGGVGEAGVNGGGSAGPRGKEWTAGTIAGGLLLGGGNGAVVVAGQWVPSGLAALLVGTVPLWIVLVDWLAGSRVCPSTRSGMWVVVGVAAIGILAGSPGVGAGGPGEAVAAVLGLAGCAPWACGSHSS